MTPKSKYPVKVSFGDWAQKAAAQIALLAIFAYLDGD
jgi:hypothetical protein